MADWYKHDIAAWMDGTEHLDDGPYRVYHVVCQLIYLNEGPIRINEHGIAGRCKQPIRSFRANLSRLVELGLLSSSEGRLSNLRAKKELEKIGENRLNASKGGKARAKSLEIQDTHQASLKEPPALRLDKTRLEEKERGATKVAPSDQLSLEPSPTATVIDTEEAGYFRRARELLGDKAGGLAKQLLIAKGSSYSEARSVLEKSVGKGHPVTWIRGCINRDKVDASKRSADTIPGWEYPSTGRQ